MRFLITVVSKYTRKHIKLTTLVKTFKNYGSNSSRTRTIVIGVSKEMAEYISPIELYPNYVEEIM